MELSYIYIMKIKAKRSWSDLATQRDFVSGRVYEVDDNYGDKVVKIGHAELVDEVKPEPVKKTKKK